MVDQDDDSGLVLAAYRPGDVRPGEPVSSAILAWFAYPESVGRHTHARALATASHAAALDPLAATTLAALLDALAGFAVQVDRLGGQDAAAPLLGPALQFTDIYTHRGE
ncbi:hypothetical protein ACIQF6_33700 [Kitasatospora sp. NPDC092948]|uniref:hypothetical protein n=1 Tax=Kitasatospora sp. NPDC092948 TaxID=3364088 RepID=UPI0037FA90E9